MTGRTRLLLATICGVAVAGVYAGQPALGRMGDDLEVPAATVGWFVAIAQLGYLAGLVLLVPLGDLLNRRRLIGLQLTLAAVGLSIVAVAPNATVALVGLGVAGLFAVTTQTAVAYAAALSGPAERGRNLGIVTSGVVIGILGSRILAGLLAGTWGWRSIYVALAALTAAVALISLRGLPPDARTGATLRYRSPLRDFGDRLTERTTLGRGLIAFFLFASFGTLWSGLALPLADAPWHLDETQIGLLGLAGLAGALGAARAGRWADAGQAARATGVGLAVLLASWVAIGQLTWSLPLLILGVVLLDFAVQTVHVSNQHALTIADPERSSTAIGAYMIFYSLGSAAGAASTTALYDAVGWWGSSALGLGFAAAGALTWTLVRRGAVPGWDREELADLHVEPDRQLLDRAERRTQDAPLDLADGRGRELRCERHVLLGPLALGTNPQHRGRKRSGGRCRWPGHLDDADL